MFHSQDNQDFVLESRLFKGYKNGFFMDIGAHDGVNINNTLYFEENNNWTGINVEPIKEVFEKLVVNRPKSININCAVCNNDGTADFLRISADGPEMLSRLQNNLDSRHIERIHKDIETTQSSSHIVTVDTKKIETICDEHNVTHIHYLSIDVEGAEFDVIKSINFEKVFIDVIGFENNYPDVSVPIVHYLQSKNYLFTYEAVDIFMIHKDSIFLKNNH